MTLTLVKTAATALTLPLIPMASIAQSARDVVIKGLSAVFVTPDVEVIETYFAPDYIQHNPIFPNGRETVVGFATNPPPGMEYQIGNVIADEAQGLVAAHFRVTGFGPKPLVGVDILRVANGQIV